MHEHTNITDTGAQAIHTSYEGRYKSNASNFFSENVTAITMKFIRIIHTSFAIIRLLFHKVSGTLNILLPTLCKTLYTNVVKFHAYL
jgi:hypothetical protein